MNAFKQLYSDKWTGNAVRSVVTTITIAAMTWLTGGHARAGGTVTSCTEANLCAAMAGGGTVTFTCDGTITLASTISNSAYTVLDGTGHQITISGNNAVQVFYVNANATLTLLNLTIANGCVAGPFVTSGISTDAPNLAGRGGAILNFGNLMLQDCVFSNNQAIGGDVFLGYGGSGQGGAIFNLGTNVIDNCVFQQNLAKGGYGGSPSYGFSPAGGGYAEGGAIYNFGSLTINYSSISSNSTFGHFGSDGSGQDYTGNGITGGSGGAAHGSGIYNVGSLVLQNSTLAMNYASGGTGGTGSPGGSTSYVQYTGVGAGGGRGGSGGFASGALYNAGAATLVNDTVALNAANGGRSGTGGTGGLTDLGNPPWVPNGSGGSGGAGGSAYGGIFGTSGNLQMTNCTVASNSSVAGSGGSGGLGGSGNIYPTGTAGSNGVAGASVGGVGTSGCVVANTLMASNTPLNWSGTKTDSGHNISSDASSAFTDTSSRNNVNPMLGPLADNGGPTLTMALLPGSPAIDAGTSVNAPATDQRGVPRPQGWAVDMGAFEYLDSPIFMDATMIRSATNCQMQLCGLTPNPTLTLQVSTNLLNWWDATSFMAGSNGVFQCVDPIPGDAKTRFYRLKSANP